jgi:hypothetical protein
MSGGLLRSTLQSYNATPQWGVALRSAGYRTVISWRRLRAQTTFR